MIETTPPSFLRYKTTHYQHQNNNNNWSGQHSSYQSAYNCLVAAYKPSGDINTAEPPLSTKFCSTMKVCFVPYAPAWWYGVGVPPKDPRTITIGSLLSVYISFNNYYAFQTELNRVAVVNWNDRLVVSPKNCCDPHSFYYPLPIRCLGIPIVWFTGVCAKLSLSLQQKQWHVWKGRRLELTLPSSKG